MRYAVSVAPRPHHRVVESPFGDDVALFHLDTRRLHMLNGSAAAIWHQLHETDTIGDLAVRLGDRFGVSPIEIRADVERTVQQLTADGLLEVGDCSARTDTRARSGSAPAHVDIPDAGSYAALDARIGVICDDAEILDWIGAALGPLRCDAAPGVAIRIRARDDARWSLRVGDGEELTFGSRLSVALRAVGEVNNLAVASVPDQLVFHAGAVSDDGRGVLLPGGSNHGKSTLTAALITDGFRYLTDEAAAITEDLHIRPFAKSIALDPGSFPLFPELAPSGRLVGLSRAVAGREWHVDPVRVGPVSGPAPVAAVICPRWRAGAATRVSPVEPVEALHLLLGDTFEFSRGGPGVFGCLVELVQSVPVVKLSYGETAAAVDAVREILESVD
jgi:hypothetical protein